MQSLTSAYEVVRLRTYYKHQICLGYSLMMSKPQFMKGLSIQACDPQLPDHRHSHEYMNISIGWGVAEELQIANKREGTWKPLCSKVIRGCCTILNLLLQYLFSISFQAIGHGQAVLVEVKEELWEVADCLQNQPPDMGISHLIRPGGTPSHCPKTAVPIMLCRNQLVSTIIIQVFIQSTGLLTRQMFHGRGDVGTIFHKFKIMWGLAWDGVGGLHQWLKQPVPIAFLTIPHKQQMGIFWGCFQFPDGLHERTCGQ